ncbi:MAG: hypothetical protein C4347_02175 [Patescibacteria group bacterium]
MKKVRNLYLISSVVFLILVLSLEIFFIFKNFTKISEKLNTFGKTPQTKIVNYQEIKSAVENISRFISY